MEAPEGSALVTYHVPSIQCLDGCRSDPVSDAFASNLDELILEYQRRIYIHGYTHESFDYRTGKTGMVGNPQGCASTEKNKAFWMPDQVRHDDSRTFYEIINFAARTQDD